MKVRNISSGTIEVQSKPKKVIRIQPGEVYDMDQGMARRLLKSETPMIRAYNSDEDHKAMNGSTIPNSGGKK